MEQHGIFVTSPSVMTHLPNMIRKLTFIQDKRQVPFKVHPHLTTQRYSLSVIPLEIPTSNVFYTINTRGPKDKTVKLKLWCSNPTIQTNSLSKNFQRNAQQRSLTNTLLYEEWYPKCTVTYFMLLIYVYTHLYHQYPSKRSLDPLCGKRIEK